MPLLTISRDSGRSAISFGGTIADKASSEETAHDFN